MTRRSWIGLLSATAAILSLVLGSLQSVAWSGVEAPALARGIAGWLDPALVLEMPARSAAQPSESYFGYGRLVFVIYLLLAAAGMLTRARLPGRVGIALAALFSLAALGDITAYWISEAAGPGVRRIGFWYLEVPALVACLLILTGVGALRARAREPGRAWLLCLPLSLAATVLLGYLPHGFLLGLSLTIGIASIEDPQPATQANASNASLSWRGRAFLAMGSALIALALAAMYRPTLRAGLPADLAPMIFAETLAGARLHVFNTGYNRMTWLLVGRDRPWRPVPAFVLEDPKSGLLVFDTGLPDAVALLGEAGMHAPERWVIESRSAPALMLPAQMRSAELDPSAVQLVAISHLHGDHVGQLAAFTNARMIGGRGSAELAMDANLGDRWQDQLFEPHSRFGPFDETSDIAGDDGIVLIRGGGHTPEGIMLLLALEEGPVLLAGDAAVHSDWLRSNDVQRIAVEPDRAATVRNQIRAFVDAVPGASVAYGHDLRGIDCGRSDIVCHGEERFHPEGEQSPSP